MEEYKFQTRGAAPEEEAGNSYSSWEATERGLACPRGPPGKTGDHKTIGQDVKENNKQFIH